MKDEYISIRIPRQRLEDHVERICKGNLKGPCKICYVCPILEPVLKVMDAHGWPYNQQELKNFQQSNQDIDTYWARYKRKR